MFGMYAFGASYFADGPNGGFVPPPPGGAGSDLVGVHVSPGCHGSYTLVGVRL